MDCKVLATQHLCASLASLRLVESRLNLYLYWWATLTSWADKIILGRRGHHSYQVSQAPRSECRQLGPRKPYSSYRMKMAISIRPSAAKRSLNQVLARTHYLITTSPSLSSFLTVQVTPACSQVPKTPRLSANSSRQCSMASRASLTLWTKAMTTARRVWWTWARLLVHETSSTRARPVSCLKESVLDRHTVRKEVLERRAKGCLFLKANQWGRNSQSRWMSSLRSRWRSSTIEIEYMWLKMQLICWGKPIVIKRMPKEQSLWMT